MDQFSRSKSLNNIPIRKLQEKLLEIVEACEICSKKASKIESLSDGLCQKCALKNVIFQRYYESNLPIEYWNLRMDKDFQGDPRLLVKYNEIVSDLKNFYIEGRCLCLAGNYGRGKTLTSTNILKQALHKGYSTLYTTLSDIVNVLTSASNEERFLARKELVICDFVCIDEFDQRYVSSDNAANLYARTLENIFRTRASNKLPLLLCTNSPNSLEMFNGDLKQSLESLMNGYLETFIVLGDDFRKNK